MPSNGMLVIFVANRPRRGAAGNANCWNTNCKLCKNYPATSSRVDQRCLLPGGKTNGPQPASLDPEGQKNVVSHIAATKRTRFSPLFGVLLAITVLYLAREIFVPLALALLFGFLLSPLVKHLERWHVRRSPAPSRSP